MHLHVPVPDSWESQNTVMLLYMLTAVYVIEQAELRTGETVLIHPPWGMCFVSREVQNESLSVALSFWSIENNVLINLLIFCSALCLCLGYVPFVVLFEAMLTETARCFGVQSISFFLL